MMCGNDKIRYVHIVEHDDVAEEFMVGCDCASKMTNDYVNPDKKERALRNKANRRINWLRKEWKISKNRNIYLKRNGTVMTIYRRQDRKFSYVLHGLHSLGYSSIEEAKIAIFNILEREKEGSNK